MYMEIGYVVVSVAATTRDPGLQECGAGVEWHRGAERGYREPEGGYGWWGSGTGTGMVDTLESVGEYKATEGCQKQGHRGRVLGVDHV